MIFRTALLLFAVASLIALPQSSHAAFITHTTPGTYNAAVGSLFLTGSTGFESDAVGGKPIGGFNSGGIGFVGSTLLPPPGAMALAVLAGPTTAGNNYLGIDGGFGDFNGNSAPNIGDILTINVPANSRALGVNVVTNIPPDTTSFARLAIGATTVDLFMGQPGTVLGGSGFISYFLGITGPLAGDTYSTATLSFVGGGTAFRVDNVTVYAATAIPEPTSLALVAVAGLAGLVRRRVRRS